MKTIYLCWVEDVQSFVDSLRDSIKLIESDHGVLFNIDPHENTDHIDSIARALKADDKDLIFFVDYNLKAPNGDGMDGHEVIQLIRQYNNVCQIVFYSSQATQSDLRALIGDLPNVRCVIRESIKEILVDIAIERKDIN